MVSATSGVEPEPSTGISTDPSGSSPPQVLRTYCQHMADHMRLMMESGMDLNLGQGQGSSADHQGILLLSLLHNIHQLSNPFLISYTLDVTPSFHFPLGLTEDLIGQLHPLDCGSLTHGHCTTAGGGFIGFPSLWPHRSLGRKVAAITNLNGTTCTTSPSIYYLQAYSTSTHISPPGRSHQLLSLLSTISGQNDRSPCKMMSYCSHFNPAIHQIISPTWQPSISWSLCKTLSNSSHS